jgi:hypothetical protein
MTEMMRPQRAAASACKRRLHEQLTTRKRTKKTSAQPKLQKLELVPRVPEFLNDRDAITLEPIDPHAPTSFWARADDGGEAVYVHDATLLLRFCSQAETEPRDPVTMRPFDASEISRLERAAGVAAGFLEQSRIEAQAARQAAAEAAPLQTEENQIALLQALADTVTDAFDEALACSQDEMLGFVGYAVLQLGPAVRALLQHIEITQDVVTSVGNQAEEGLARAGPASVERPHVATCAAMVADVVVDELRCLIHASTIQASTTPPL